MKNLRNEEHNQFHAEMKNLIEVYGAKALNIELLFEAYQKQFVLLGQALQQIRKSMESDLIEESDHQRDMVFRGMSDTVKSALHHFNSAKQEAAERVQIVLNQYGNMARKAHHEETASIYKLISEFTKNYPAEMQQLGLEEWIAELTVRNNAFDTLMKTRYSKEAERTTLHMKAVRTETDQLYREIIARIDALITLQDPQISETFVRELNVRIDKYAVLLSVRKGRKHHNGLTTDN